MINNELELDRLNKILKEHPKGLTIAEISKQLPLNRISTSKYLNILLGAGMAEMRIYGPSKVFYPAQRVPISSILNFSTSLLLVMNDNLSIIDANNTLLNLFSLEKIDLLGHRIDYSPLGSFIDPDLLSLIKKALNSTENSIDVSWMIRGEEKYLSVKITPTVFEDGSCGVTLIADDVTELTRYRKNLEKLVDERSRELNLINE
ncbi:MAG: PAS domain-containing protein, partial [Methanospirillum sp.]|uniref:PAS domain-containing protein n=1 Tax=Methanospirillum sp. TaxID=45200 RepID=UPI00236D4358